MLGKFFALLTSGSLNIPLALPCSSKTGPINIIGADYMTSLLIQIHAQPQALGKTFHIVNPSPPTISQLLQKSAKIIGIRGLRLAERKCLSLEEVDRSIRHLNRRIADKLAIYWRYFLYDHPVFDMANVREI